MIAVHEQFVRILTPDAPHLRTDVQTAADLLDMIVIGAAMHTMAARRAGRQAVPPQAGVLADLFLSGVTVPVPGSTTTPLAEARPSC